MASGPLTSWQIDGKTVETVKDFILGGSKITADGDCSHDIKRRLLLGRKVMTNLDSIFKSRDITLPTKVCLVKAKDFPGGSVSGKKSSLLGANVRHSTHGKGHEEGGSTYAKAGLSLRSPPGNSQASTPKPESAYFLLCALTYTSDFMGAVPHYLSLKKELAYSSS